MAFTQQQKERIINNFGRALNGRVDQLFNAGNEEGEVLDDIINNYRLTILTTLGLQDSQQNRRDFMIFISGFIHQRFQTYPGGKGGKSFYQGPGGTGMPGGGRIGKQRLQNFLKDEEIRLRGGENQLIRNTRGLIATNFNNGMVIVNVKNNSKRDSFEVNVNCSTGQSQRIQIIRKGRTRRFTFIVPVDVQLNFECDCSSHEVKPDFRQAFIKGVIRQNQNVSKPGNIDFELTSEDREKRSKERKERDKESSSKIKGLVKARRDYHSRMLYPIMLLLTGFIISALLGVVWFTFAFLAFAANKLIPPPKTGADIIDRLKDIKSRNERLISEAERRGDQDGVDKLYKRMKYQMEAEQVIGKFKWSQLTRNGFNNYYGKGLLREFFKAIGFLMFAIAFVFSDVPMAPVIGIIIGFSGYFMLGGSGYHDNESTKKEFD